MKYDFKGEKKLNTPIQNFIDLLDSVQINQWLYNGLRVAIDPTIDFTNNNVLVRWLDTNEGFNDKIIYKSLNSFQKDFTLLNA